MHVYVDYPEEKSERDIMLLVRSEEQPGDTAKPAGSAPPPKVAQEIIFDARNEIHAIQMAEAVESYIVDLIQATHTPER